MEQKNRFHLNAGEAVLLVIDLQERLMAAMDHAPQVLKNTKLLLLAAEQLQFPVLVTEQYPKGLGATSAELLEANDSWSYGMTEDEVRAAFSLIATEWAEGEN